MRKLLIKESAFFLVIFSANFSANSQTYEAKYKATYESSIHSNNTTDTLTNENSKIDLPFRIIVVYTIITDGKYMIATGKTEETSSLFGGAINFHSSNNEVIFDLVNQLVYYPETKKVQRFKKYSLTKDSLSKNRFSIEGVDSTYFVEFNPNLKNYISPGVFFSHTIYGVNKIHTSDLNIELIEPVKKTNKKLSLSEYFKKIDKTKITEEYEFF